MYDIAIREVNEGTSQWKLDPKVRRDVYYRAHEERCSCDTQSCWMSSFLRAVQYDNGILQVRHALDLSSSILSS